MKKTRNKIKNFGINIRNPYGWKLFRITVKNKQAVFINFENRSKWPKWQLFRTVPADETTWKRIHWNAESLNQRVRNEHCFSDVGTVGWVTSPRTLLFCIFFFSCLLHRTSVSSFENLKKSTCRSWVQCRIIRCTSLSSRSKRESQRMIQI